MRAHDDSKKNKARPSKRDELNTRGTTQIRTPAHFSGFQQIRCLNAALRALLLSEDFGCLLGSDRCKEALLPAFSKRRLSANSGFRILFVIAFGRI